MDTKLSLTEIELSVMRYFQAPLVNMAVCNISYGLLHHEVDVCILSKNNYLTEIEIKRSYSDFLADFKKHHHHDNDIRIKKFYYCVPESIIGKVMTVLKEKVEDKTLKQLPAVLTYDEKGSLKVREESGNPILKFHTARPLTDSEVIQFYRLGTMRLYNMQETNLRLSRDYHELYNKYDNGLAINKIRPQQNKLFKEQSELLDKKYQLVRQARLVTETEEKTKLNDEILDIEFKLERINGKLDAYNEIIMA